MPSIFIGGTLIIMEPITLELPIYLKKGKRKPKTISLNLNCYRNWSFFENNDIKILFEEVVKPRIAHLPQMTKVDLTYTLFFGSRRSIDVSNFCCIVDKFFCDTLVNHMKISDDNMEIISNVNYRWGAVDKTNPRIEVTLSNIERVQEKKNPMQIILNESEIKDAIRAHVLNQVAIPAEQAVSIEMKAGRSEDGFTATISVVKPATTETMIELSAVQIVKEAEPAVTGKKLPDVGNRTFLAPKAASKAAIQAEPAEAAATAQEIVPETGANPAQAGAVEAAEPANVPAAAAEAASATPTVAQAAKAATPAKSIFPTIGASTPPMSGAAGPATAPAKPAAKSLFANLTPPVHDTPATPAA